MKKEFVAYFYCNGFDHVSLGLHFDWVMPNIEIHLPFGFIRIGWVEKWENFNHQSQYRFLYRSFGLNEGWNSD